MGALLSDLPSELHVVFLTILPRIERHGHVYFRHVKNAALKEEYVAEMVALAWKWCVRLAELGKDPLQFPSAVASFAARAVRCGRRLCGQEGARDVLSPLAQGRHGFAVSSLRDCGAPAGGAFSEALADNTVSPVPEQAAFRLDFPEWLRTYDERRRLVIADLMMGERTGDAARRHGVSPARVSQMRREFRRDWRLFVGDAG